jgi:NAD(P)-dependent dehydrogenase (short-subunit alcohol dehydrogenase family)
MPMQKSVVLTGGASGVGAATAKLLAEENVDLTILDIKTPPGDIGTYVRCDLSDKAIIDAAIGKLPNKIDALINAAGIPGPQPGEAVLRVNFLGLRHLTETILDRVTDGGSIVNVASTAGADWMRRAEPVLDILDSDGFDAGVEWSRANEERWAKDPYTFSKQCVVAYTKHAAGAALDRRVRVNSVSPGAIDTPILPDFAEQIGHEQFQWTVDQVGRPATPTEISEVIRYLAIGDCGWVNGVDLTIDGGFTAGLTSGWIDFSKSPRGISRAAAKRKT